MIIVLKPQTEQERVEGLLSHLHAMGLGTNYSKGAYSTVIGLIGDTSTVDIRKLDALDYVEKVTRVSEPYKLANRKFHADDTVVTAGAAAVGGGVFAVIAGPCSIESEGQITEVAMRVKKAGATMLRGGAFKPRTSPYAFQGMGREGIKLLLAAKKATGLPVVTELMSTADLDAFSEVDVIQVGARNMQNFDMLKELGRCDKPILLKRGLSATVEEWLMSAEYIMAGGNPNVVLCERGIRTFEKETRNTLDLSAVPLIKKHSHLPIVVDPSHATGKRDLVLPLAKAAVVCGADGLMVEVHNDPATALCDGPQSLTPDQFDGLMRVISPLCKMENKQFTLEN